MMVFRCFELLFHVQSLCLYIHCQWRGAAEVRGGVRE